MKKVKYCPSEDFFYILSKCHLFLLDVSIRMMGSCAEMIQLDFTLDILRMCIDQKHSGRNLSKHLIDNKSWKAWLRRDVFGRKNLHQILTSVKVHGREVWVLIMVSEEASIVIGWEAPFIPPSHCLLGAKVDHHKITA